LLEITMKSLKLRIGLIAAAALIAISGCHKREDASATRKPAAYEGQYANASGKVVLEIKEGRVIFTNPATKTKTDTSFSPTDDGMLVESGSGTFTLKFNPPDTISGLPPAIAGSAGDVKKIASAE